MGYYSRLSDYDDFHQEYSEDDEQYSDKSNDENSYTSLARFGNPHFIKILNPGNKGHCTLCDIKMACHINNFKSHSEGRKHLYNFKALYELNNPDQLAEFGNKHFIIHTCHVGYSHCTLCDVKLSAHIFTYKQHIEGNKHQANLTSKRQELENFGNQNFIKLLDGGKSICTLCNIYISSNMYNFKEHVKGNNHVAKHNHKELENFGNRHFIKLLNGGKSFCSLCNIHLLSDMYNFKEHVEGNNHFKNQQNFQLKNYGNHNFIKLYGNNAQCLLCDVNIPYNMKNFQQHIQGSNHRANENSDNFVTSDVALFGKQNFIKLNENRGLCFLCDVNVPLNISNLKSHVEGSKHRSILNNQ